MALFLGPIPKLLCMEYGNGPQQKQGIIMVVKILFRWNYHRLQLHLLGGSSEGYVIHSRVNITLDIKSVT